MDVDPVQPVLYNRPGDTGPVGTRGGSVRLVHGTFPGDPKVAAAVGTGYDLFVSKNTLKNGYLHPAQPVDPRTRVDVGADDPAFLKAAHAALKPGGLVVIYNLTGKPTPPGPAYSPQTDGRCPFSAADLTAAGFTTLVRDRDAGPAARAVGHALGWDKPPAKMVLETDLFGLATVARRK